MLRSSITHLSCPLIMCKKIAYCEFLIFIIAGFQNTDGGSRASDYASNNLVAAWVLCKVSIAITDFNFVTSVAPVY